jgi:hypothetical protein
LQFALASEYRGRKPQKKTKYCKRCEKTLPVKSFGINQTRPDGLEHWCKACRNTRYKGRYADRSKASSWFKSFGITPAQYHALFEKQAGVCAICGKPETKTVKGTLAYLSVDHDHETGAIRGLLCDKCNGGIGHFNDDIALLERAVAYLRSHEHARSAPIPQTDRAGG